MATSTWCDINNNRTFTGSREADHCNITITDVETAVRLCDIGNAVPVHLLRAAGLPITS